MSSLCLRYFSTLAHTTSAIAHALATLLYCFLFLIVDKGEKVNKMFRLKVRKVYLILHTHRYNQRGRRRFVYKFRGFGKTIIAVSVVKAYSNYTTNNNNNNNDNTVRNVPP